MNAEKILIVDDEDAVRNLCVRTLKKGNYNVASASSADKALGLLTETSAHFDIVISDLLMPGHADGKELLHMVKNKFPATDVIIMTAQPTTETAILALKEGAYDYMTKPFSPDALTSVVNRCLEKRRLKMSLDKAYKELKNLNDSREMFMQLLVHDMKNPLSGIMGNAQILLMDKREQEEQETLQDILHSSQRLHEMVINLLDIGRMEEGRLLPKYEPIPVVQLLDEIIKLIGNQFKQKRIKVSTEVKPNNLVLLADHDLMLRIFQNILDNCLRYTMDGGGVEMIITNNGEELKTARDGERKENAKEEFTLIRIRDSGQPIPKEHYETIFTRYGRIAKHGDRTNRGLGLYFCKLAVESHGGTIELEEIKDSKWSSSFLIKLPNKVGKLISNQSSSG